MVCLWPLIAFLCGVDKLLPSAIYISLFVMKKPCGESLFSDLNLVSSLSSSSWLSSELNFSWNFVDPIFLHSVIGGVNLKKGSWGALIMANVYFL